MIHICSCIQYAISVFIKRSNICAFDFQYQLFFLIKTEIK